MPIGPPPWQFGRLGARPSRLLGARRATLCFIQQPPAMQRPEKITIGQMRSSGVPGVLITAPIINARTSWLPAQKNGRTMFASQIFRRPLSMFGVWSPRRRYQARLGIQKVSEGSDILPTRLPPVRLIARRGCDQGQSAMVNVANETRSLLT